MTAHAVNRAAEEARAVLSEGLWAYLSGGAETETALRRNREALDELALVPRMLTDVREVDPSRQFLGRRLALPVLLAPVGSLHLLHADGIHGVASAAHQAGVAHAVGCAVQGADVWQATAGQALSFYQIYVNGDDDWLDQQVESAMLRGFAGVIITVDAPVFPARRRDIAAVNHASNRQHEGTSVFRKSFTWDSLRRLIARHPGVAFIPKGLQDPRDVLQACETGAAAVYLSNHGGRQYDQGPGMASLIEGAANALAGRVPLIVDGGFASGNDVLKALALGADLVALGRAHLYPYASQGAAGLTAWLRNLEQELVTNMRLLGITRLADLDEIQVWIRGVLRWA